MAKFIKINDNLSINIDSIYSIAKEISDELVNQDIVDDYEKKLKECCSDLPYLEIETGLIWKPSPSINNSYYDDLYVKKLEIWLKENLGEPPEKIYVENYYLILTIGTKVNIDEIIYNKLIEYVEE